ncbi:MAG: Asp-tRNA(Asn)/Glu-tRNA(Gln) amidotransferase subunit GatC [Dethiobacteria bacterium]
MQINDEELKNASWDARIILTQQEKKELHDQLQTFFKLAEVLQDIDLSEVEASFDALQGYNTLRKDIIEPSLPLQLSLENAPDADSSSFHVPKIVEE